MARAAATQTDPMVTIHCPSGAYSENGIAERVGTTDCKDQASNRRI